MIRIQIQIWTGPGQDLDWIWDPARVWCGAAPAVAATKVTGPPGHEGYSGRRHVCITSLFILQRGSLYCYGAIAHAMVPWCQKCFAADVDE